MLFNPGQKFLLGFVGGQFIKTVVVITYRNNVPNTEFVSGAVANNMVLFYFEINLLAGIFVVNNTILSVKDSVRQFLGFGL